MNAKLLTTKEVGAMLRIAPRTVRDLIDCGDLIAVRVGKRKWRISEDTVDAYVRARTTSTNVVRLVNPEDEP